MRVIDDNVVNATNNAFKTQMVLYKNYKGTLFVRDFDEFIEKFTETDIKQIPIPKD